MTWTYTADSCGYMLFKDGVSQGGASTLGTATHTSDGRIRHWNQLYAKSVCDQRNAEEKQ